MPDSRSFGHSLLPVAALAAITLAERLSPLRPRTQSEPRRSLRNLALGGLSMAVVAAVETPLAGRLAAAAERYRFGLMQRLPWPRWARDALAVLALDYTTYVWHVLTHEVPGLWRLHLVHHIDLDLDASTALRFHAIDMLVSAPWRCAQVALIGASPRALRLWQGLFYGSVLFHHSNLRLPEPLERRLARVLTTPRMHEIHHTANHAQTSANWSSGLSLWDHLHGTFRLDAPLDPIGVPAYRDPREAGLLASLLLPFVRQRDAWARYERDSRTPAA